MPGGNYQQSQQSYSYVDGNAHVQHTQSQQSWSWQSQTTTPMVQSPPVVQTPQLSAITQTSAHQQLHQKMQQNAINLHQQMMAATMGSMSTMTQQRQAQQPQITYQAISSPQPQISYQKSLHQQCQQQNQLTYEATSPAPQAPTQFWDNVSLQQQQPSLPPPPPPVQSGPPPMSPPPQTQPPSQPSRLQIELPSSSQNAPNYDNRFEKLERQRKQDIQSMNREGAEMNKRLANLEHSRRHDKESLEARDREIRQLREQTASNQQQQLQHRENDRRIRELEHSKSSTQKAGEAKDQEIRRLNEQIASLYRSKHQDSERHSQQVADLARRQVATPAPSQSAFDMSALQKVIRETQVQQLPSQDIERVIEEQVSKRLTGMATKADIQNAGLQMQNALSSVPKGLSEAQVQQAVNRELNNVMQDVTRRAQEKQQQQRRIEGQMQNNAQPPRNSSNQVRTDFRIEELPDRPGSERKQRAIGPAPAPGSKPVVQPPPTKQKALPAAPPPETSMPSRSNGKPHRAALEAPPPPNAPNAPMRSQRPAIPSNPAPNRGQHAAIEVAPAGTDVPSNASARVERPTPKAAAPQARMDRNALVQAGSRPQMQPNSCSQVRPQSTVVQRAQPQVSANPRPCMSRQIPASAPQRQLEAPPPGSQTNFGNGMELVRQGQDVARK